MRKQLLFIALTGFCQTAFSQHDTLTYPMVFEGKAVNDPGNIIYNGREHVSYPPLIQGNPYFFSESWQKASLIFQNILYRDVFLKYDLVADEVIVLHPIISTGVALFTPRVQSFNLEGRSFIYLSGVEEQGLKAGIYEQAAIGILSLYIKHSKVIEEKVVDRALEKKFTDKDVYFVLKDGRYHPVRKQKDVIDLMLNKKEEINSFLKRQEIRYKDNREVFLINLIQHYNQLNP